MISYEVMSDILFDRVALARAVYAVSRLSRRVQYTLNVIVAHQICLAG